MPFNRIYYPPGLFSAADKAAIAKGITDIYAEKYPPRGTLVIFHPIPEESFYRDGKPSKGLVRITLQFLEDSWDARDWIKVQQAFINSWKPYIMDRGIDYELQIEEAPLKGISFNGWNPVTGDEYWANEHYDQMVKEDRLIPGKGIGS